MRDPEIETRWLVPAGVGTRLAAAGLVPRAAKLGRPLGFASESALESMRGLWQIQGMNANELKQLLQARPFHPLTIRMGRNKTYSIPHPEFAALSPAGDTLIVWLNREGGADMVDVPLIESVAVRKRAAPRS